MYKAQGVYPANAHGKLRAATFGHGRLYSKRGEKILGRSKA